MASRKKRPVLSLDGGDDTDIEPGQDQGQHVPDVDRAKLGEFAGHARVSTRRPLTMVPANGPARRIFGIRLTVIEDEWLKRLGAREQRSKHEITRALLIPATLAALQRDEDAPPLNPRRAKSSKEPLVQVSVKLTDEELETLRRLAAREARSQQQVVRAIFLSALEHELGEKIPEE